MSAPVSLFPFSTDNPQPPWQTFVVGSGALEIAGNTVRLIMRPATTAVYSDAQIDDYQRLPRSRFLWRPPLKLTVRARFSHAAGELRGTAGFGFWNDPFMMTGLRRPMLPRAIWFFYSSPPSNMKLDLRAPGPGWKAATIDALRWSFAALLPTAPLAIPLMNIDGLYRACWPVGQRAIGVSEKLVVAPMTGWHTYVIDWQLRRANFWVDDELVLASPTAPGGPLGFVLWLDNQYMVVTPWGKFGYGWLATPGEQWLEVDRLEIAPSAEKF